MCGLSKIFNCHKGIWNFFTKDPSDHTLHIIAGIAGTVALWASAYALGADFHSAMNWVGFIASFVGLISLLYLLVEWIEGQTTSTWVARVAVFIPVFMYSALVALSAIIALAVTS